MRVPGSRKLGHLVAKFENEQGVWGDAPLNLATAIGIVFVACIGLALTFPGSNTPVFWPPTAAALAVVLTTARRAWLGILVGLAISELIHPVTAGHTAWDIALSSIWPFVGLAQAVLARHFIRRFDGFPNPYTSVGPLARVVFFGGAASMLGASLKAILFAVENTVDALTLGQMWGAWWGSDTLAILFLTPFMLAWCARPKDDWIGRRSVVSAILFATFFMTLAVVRITSGYESKALVADFEQTGETIGDGLERQMIANLNVVASLKNFESSTPPPSDEAFATFAASLFPYVPSLRGFGWAPHVMGADRKAFEAFKSANGSPGFTINDPVNRDLKPAPMRDDYFPIAAVVMQGGNARSFDLGGTPIRRAGIELARDTGMLTVTEPTKPLLAVHGNDTIADAIMPVYKNGPPLTTIEERRAALTGVVYSSFRYASVIDAILAHYQKSDFNLWFYDNGGTASPPLESGQVTYATTPGTPVAWEPHDWGIISVNTPIIYKETFTIGQRYWSIVLTPTPDYIAQHQRHNSWIILVLGLIISGLTAGFQLIRSGQGLVLQRLVEVRTADLRMSEERFRALVETSIDCVWETRVGKGIVYISPPISDMIGYSQSEAIALIKNDPYWMFNANPEDEDWRATMRAGHSLVNVKTRTRHRDGHIVTLEVSSRPVYDDFGTLIGHRGITRDITERAQAEARLAQQQAELERHASALRQLNAIAASNSSSLEGQLDAALTVGVDLIDTSVAFIIRFVGDNATLQAAASNQLLKATYKWAIADFCAHATRATVSVDLAISYDHERGTTIVSLPLIVNGEVYGALGLIGSTGDDIALATSPIQKPTLHALGDEDTEILRMLAQLIRSVIERDANSQSILDAKARLETILDNTPIAISIVTRDPTSGRRVFSLINKAVSETYGPQPGGWLGHYPRELHFTEQSYDDLRKKSSALLLRGETFQDDLIMRKSDGSAIDIRLIGKMIDHKRAELGYAWIGVDMTQRKIDERRLLAILAELEAKADDLARSNAELEQFAYVASHDLRQPLRQVTSYLGLIERRLGPLLDETGREFMSFAKNGAARMDALIVDILTLSRVGRTSTKMLPVKLSDVMEIATNTLLSQIHDRNAIVTVVTDLPTVMGDISELTRLFENLIGNAVKYCPPDRPPVVTISAVATVSPQGIKGTTVTVADNGIGIDVAYYERVFGVFQRLHGSDEFEGTGIGLAICRKVVDHHKGKIWVESEINVGSRFNVSLPVYQPKATTDGSDNTTSQDIARRRLESLAP